MMRWNSIAHGAGTAQLEYVPDCLQRCKGMHGQVQAATQSAGVESGIGTPVSAGGAGAAARRVGAGRHHQRRLRQRGRELPADAAGGAGGAHAAAGVAAVHTHRHWLPGARPHDGWVSLCAHSFCRISFDPMSRLRLSQFRGTGRESQGRIASNGRRQAWHLHGGLQSCVSEWRPHGQTI